MAVARLPHHDRAVVGRHRLDLDGRAAPHIDALLLQVGLAPLAPELVAGGSLASNRSM